MIKFNSISFAASLAVDFREEVDDLRSMIDTMPDDGGEALDECIRLYRHLHSFLQGVKYMADHLAAGEDRDELMEIINKQLEDDLDANWHPLMELHAARELGEDVLIVSHYGADGTHTYTVRLEGDDPRDFASKEDVRKYLHGIKAAMLQMGKYGK